MIFTPDHRVLTTNRGFVAARDLRISDRIKTAEGAMSITRIVYSDDRVETWSSVPLGDGVEAEIDGTPSPFEDD